MKKPIYCSIMAVAFMLAAVSFAHAQEKARSLVFDAPFTDEPVKIVNVTLDGRSFLSMTDFKADKDWLRKLSFTIRNVSDRKIVHFVLVLNVTEPGLQREFETVSGGFGIPVGVLPDEVYQKRKKVLVPGEETKVSLEPFMLERLEKHIKETAAEEITKAKIFFNMILFEDKTGWNRGKVLVQDANNPRMWVEKKP